MCNDTRMVRGQFWKIVTEYVQIATNLQVTYNIFPYSDIIQIAPAFVNQNLSGLWIACAHTSVIYIALCVVLLNP